MARQATDARRGGESPPTTDLRRLDQLVAEPEPSAGDRDTPGPAAPSVTTAEPPKCPTRTRLYRCGELVDEGFAAEQLSERLAADRKTVAWLDLYDPTRADLQI